MILLRAVGPGGSRSTVEAEWRATRQLALSLEMERASGDERAVGGRLTTAWALLHDDALDLHVQAFAAARLPFGAQRRSPRPDPADDSGLPVSAGVHGAIRRGVFTMRSELGVDGGGAGPDRLLVRGRSALLLGGRFGFAGAEVVTDIGHVASWSAAPEVGLDIAAAGLPLRLGLAVPVRMDGPHTVAIITAACVDIR